MPMMRKKLNLSPLDRQGSFPFYTIAPVAGTILCNMLTYYGSRLITRGLPHWDLTLPLDRWIPFVPSAVSIYVLAFLSWVVGIWVIARESPAVCYEVLAGEQIAKLLCLACFLLLPTTMERPEVTGSGPAHLPAGFPGQPASLHPLPGKLDLLPRSSSLPEGGTWVSGWDVDLCPYGVCLHPTGEAASGAGCSHWRSRGGNWALPLPADWRWADL